MSFQFISSGHGTSINANQLTKPVLYGYLRTYFLARLKFGKTLALLVLLILSTMAMGSHITCMLTDPGAIAKVTGKTTLNVSEVHGSNSTHNVSN